MPLDMTKMDLSGVEIDPEQERSVYLKQTPEYHLMVAAFDALETGKFAPFTYAAKEFEGIFTRRDGSLERSARKYENIIYAESIEDLAKSRDQIYGFISTTDYRNSVNEVSMEDLIKSPDLAGELSRVFQLSPEEAKKELDKPVISNPNAKPGDLNPETQQEEEKEENKDMSRPTTVGKTALKKKAAPASVQESPAARVAGKKKLSPEQREARRKKREAEEAQALREQEERERQEAEENPDTLLESLEMLEQNGEAIMNELGTLPLIISASPATAVAWGELVTDVAQFLVKAAEIKENYLAFQEDVDKLPEEAFAESDEEESEEDEDFDDEE